MSLKLLESLDNKIFTVEMKESLEKEFNEAVDTKAKILVEDDDDEWDILSEDVDTQIDKEVNEEYISDKN